MNHDRIVAAMGLLVLSWCGVCNADWPAVQYASSSLPQSLAVNPASFHLPRRLPLVDQFDGRTGETFIGLSISLGRSPGVVLLPPVESAIGPLFSPPYAAEYEPAYPQHDQLTLERLDLLASLDVPDPIEFAEDEPGHFRSIFRQSMRSIGQDYRNYYT